MYRSSSWTRVSDEYSSLIQSSSSSSSSSNNGNSNKFGMARLMPAFSLSAAGFSGDGGDERGHEQQLPMYEESAAETARRERARLRLAENAVHLIPIVLILCALILWLFSNTPGIGIGSEAEMILTRIEGLSIEGDIYDSGDTAQIGVIPTVDLGGTDSPRRSHDHKASRKKD